MTTFPSGNGADWLDYLATLQGRYRTRTKDAIATPELLRAWLAEHDLEPTGRVTATDVDVAGEARECLHRVAAAHVAAAAVSAADVRRVNHLLETAGSARISSAGSGLRLQRPRTVAEAVGRLAADAVRDLTGSEAGSLHACGDDTCSGIFRDTTGRRRWCSDERCGNRMRVRAHRARSAASE